MPGSAGALVGPHLDAATIGIIQELANAPTEVCVDESEMEPLTHVASEEVVGLSHDTGMFFKRRFDRLKSVFRPYLRL